MGVKEEIIDPPTTKSDPTKKQKPKIKDLGREM